LNPSAGGKSVLETLELAKGVDPSHAADYQAAIDQDSPEATASTIPPRNKYYWRVDYMVHRRPGYYVSNRMSSLRTLATELVNGQNLQGTYLGDGATYIYQAGHEYDDIFAVWDWSRLPGVTCPKITDKKLLQPKDWTFTNHSIFVGGVSDGVYGASAFDLNRDGLAGKKGWFYFDDEIVCLGAGISSTSDSLDITTSVNQCLARGDVTVDSGQGATVVPAGLQNYPQLKWVAHDQVGYVFPEPQNVTVGSQDQTGRKSEVSSASMGTPETKNVFSLWIDHGTKPQDAHYAYVILPGATPDKLKAAADNLDVKILSNTTALQAVRQEKLKMTQAVFYQPGSLTFDTGKTLAVDKPCLVLLNENKNQVTIADPTQKQTDVTVTLNGKATKYTLPSGPLGGSSLISP
jgi:chondroitin AC lyase